MTESDSLVIPERAEVRLLCYNHTVYLNAQISLEGNVGNNVLEKMNHRIRVRYVIVN